MSKKTKKTFYFKVCQKLLYHLFERILSAGSRDPPPSLISRPPPLLSVTLPAKLRTRNPSTAEISPVGLLVHGVPDSPPLTGTWLQHQQVAEVNVGRHDLQTAPAGSIDDGLVLQGRDESSECQQGRNAVTDFRGFVDRQSRREKVRWCFSEPLRSKTKCLLFHSCWSSHFYPKSTNTTQMWKKTEFLCEDWGELGEKHWRTSGETK